MNNHSLFHKINISFAGRALVFVVTVLALFLVNPAETDARALASECYDFGDVNKDGVISQLDIDKINAYLFFGVPLNITERFRADVNDSGLPTVVENPIVDIGDRDMITSYINLPGIVDTFTVCNTTKWKPQFFCNPTGNAFAESTIYKKPLLKDKVTLHDALKILEHEAGFAPPFTTNEFEQADVNVHGHPASGSRVNSVDAAIIEQYIDGLITNVGACFACNTGVCSNVGDVFAPGGGTFIVSTACLAACVAPITPTPTPIPIPPTPTPAPCTVTPGTNRLQGCYFDVVTTAFDQPSVTAPNGSIALSIPVPDIATAIDLNPSSPPTPPCCDWWSGRWEGNFTFKAGTYTFYLGSDDGGKFYLDGVLQKDSWVDRSYTEDPVPITFTSQAVRTVKVEYYNATNPTRWSLRWTYVPPAPTPTPTPGPTTAPTPTPTTGPTPTPAQTFTISGNVFVDENSNQVKDPGPVPPPESNYAGATLTLRTGSCTGALVGTASSASTSPGYSFPNLINGVTYYIVFTPPANYVNTMPSTFCSGSDYYVERMISGANVSQDWGIIFAPLVYSISGNVFVDTNRDGLKNGAETNYTASAITITSTGGTVSYFTPPNPSGKFNVGGPLLAGTYTIYYTNLPSGYKRIYPTTGPPPQFTVTVGPPCTPGGAVSGSNSATYDASCNISNLNFAIAQYPWIQSTGTDIRIDDGFNYYIPPSGGSCVPFNSYASIAGSGGTPGIIFTGNSSAIFGQGSASSTNWIVGGSIYPELFTPTKGNIIRTSYNYIKAQIKQGGLTAAPITTWNANCIIPSGCSLTGIAHGLYSSNPPNVYINASILNCTNGANPGNCVFLINGNLNILGNITVNPGATATFIVSGNIYVNQAVGNNPTTDITTTTPQIEGFYSTDNSFIIQGIDNCSVGADKRLNIAGSVVVNAGLTVGTFQNNRDLCIGNVSCPVFSIQERPDFILNAPELIKYQNTIYREEAP